jgi:hypothetical protein
MPSSPELPDVGTRQKEGLIPVKNTNRIARAIVAVSALLFSGFAFSQTVFKVVPVPGSIPSKYMAITQVVNQ